MIDDQFTMDEEGIFYEGNAEGYKPVSVLGWLVTVTLSCLPVINIVMWFIWAFSANRPSRKTFARAMLLISLILIITSAILILFFGESMLEWARVADPDAGWRLVYPSRRFL
jgi:heme/copper-type cytochrome/quinol oxidase subunit 2